MKLPVLLALLATSASVLGLVALPRRWMTTPPTPGKYTGLLTVRRTLLPEGLETSFTVKAEASITADGRVTILTATPEAPGAAANIEKSIVRAAPNPSSIVYHDPTVTTIRPSTVAPGTTGLVPTSGNISTQPVFTLGYVNFSNYLVNGTTPATLSQGNRLVRLSYSINQSQSPTLPVTTPPPGLVPVPGPLSLNTTGTGTNATGAVDTQTASQATPNLYLPRLPGGPGVPVSSVSYEFVLRYQRPLTVTPQ
jgi:hypothetical protein